MLGIEYREAPANPLQGNFTEVFLDKWEDGTCSWIRQLSVRGMPFLPQLIYKCNAMLCSCIKINLQEQSGKTMRSGNFKVGLSPSALSKFCRPTAQLCAWRGAPHATASIEDPLPSTGLEGGDPCHGQHWQHRNQNHPNTPTRQKHHEKAKLLSNASVDTNARKLLDEIRAS